MTDADRLAAFCREMCARYGGGLDGYLTREIWNEMTAAQREKHRALAERVEAAKAAAGAGAN